MSIDWLHHSLFSYNRPLCYFYDYDCMQEENHQILELCHDMDEHRDGWKPNCYITQGGILFTCIDIISYSGHIREIKYIMIPLWEVRFTRYLNSPTTIWITSIFMLLGY